MGDLISFFLDVILIGLLLTGIVYAMRLSKQLGELRASRADMEKFVVDFSATVQRADAGVRGLKQAARDGGDDLEKLIEKAGMIRDELQFLVESADQIATRLSDRASASARTLLPEPPAPQASQPRPAAPQAPQQPKDSNPELVTALKAAITTKQESRPATSAEKDLLRALEKLG